jgi:hypothetical protein
MKPERFKLSGQKNLSTGQPTMPRFDESGADILYDNRTF